MGKLWTQNGRLMRDPDAFRLALNENCICGYTTTCQCVYHYYALWCLGYPSPPDPDVPGEYLSIDAIRECYPAWSITGATEHIFRFDDETGDGCFETFGANDEGWADWCRLPYDANPGCKEPGGEYAFCPLGVLPILAVHSGAPGCKPCDETTSGCARPSGFPGLPVNPETISECA